MEDILINLGVSALLTAIKNPNKKATMKRIFLKVFSSIWLQFSNDPEFQSVVGLVEQQPDELKQVMNKIEKEKENS